MCQLIETLQIKNGIVQRAEFHQKRLDASMQKLHNTKNNFLLHSDLDIPTNAKTGVWKCRIIYSNSIEEIEFSPYTYRKINSLQIIENPDISYSHKLKNREAITQLTTQKHDADEILITQHGRITDTSFTNIIFYDGERWVTPMSYLLNGTQRQFLLATHKITEREIHIHDLHTYQRARLINCFYDLDNGNDISITNILQ